MIQQTFSAVLAMYIYMLQTNNRFMCYSRYFFTAPATTPSTNTVDPFRPPGATKNPCGDYFPDFSCHKVDCELKICSDPELRKLCPNYCNGRCRPKDCSDIPGFVSDQ